MCKTIKQKMRFQADPRKIYDLFREASNAREKIGSSFSNLSGTVTGIVVDFKPGRRFVQAWRQKDFPPGVFSMAAIELTPTKRGGTELILTHRGVPKRLIPRTENQWRQKFWRKLKKAR